MFHLLKIDQYFQDSCNIIQKIKNIDFYAYKNSKNKESSFQTNNHNIPIVKNKQDRRTKTYNSKISNLETKISNTIDNEWEILKNQQNKHNITRQERNAFENVRNNYDIVVREADKGSAVVIMNASFYINGVNCILKYTTKYKKLNIDTDKALNKLVRQRNAIVRKYKQILDKKEVHYITNFECELAHIYVTPKVHMICMIV